MPSSITLLGSVNPPCDSIGPVSSSACKYDGVVPCGTGGRNPVAVGLDVWDCCCWRCTTANVTTLSRCRDTSAVMVPSVMSGSLTVAIIAVPTSGCRRFSVTVPISFLLVTCTVTSTSVERARYMDAVVSHFAGPHGYLVHIVCGSVRFTVVVSVIAIIIHIGWRTLCPSASHSWAGPLKVQHTAADHRSRRRRHPSHPSGCPQRPPGPRELNVRTGVSPFSAYIITSGACAKVASGEKLDSMKKAASPNTKAPTPTTTQVLCCVSQPI